MSQRCYQSVVSAAVAAAKSHQTIYQPASPTIRPALLSILVSSPSAPVDAAIDLYLYRTTAAPGTPVAVTPAAVDPQDAASNILCSKQATVEPTATTLLLALSVNQKNTYQWFAVPGAEIMMPVTANYGLTLYCNAVSSGTPLLESVLLWRE
jgi:hypothetical protein